ncbi:MAG: hypothetical protein EPN99_08795 [Frankiales bacterium]|nr:MAG: hypothetical protein EPN99_08795 [Frankiales bacterium]
MEDLLETASRCPHCRASIRPGAPWCTLCHADLRPAPEPEPAPAPVVRPVDPLTAPAALLGLPAQAGAEPTWPCTTCGAANPIAATACTACGAGFLAGLRDEAPLLEIPGVGDLTKMSRAQRLGIAFGAVVAFIVLMTLLSLLLG